MMFPLGTLISHAQFESKGYPAGYPGEEKVPDKVFMETPHAVKHKFQTHTLDRAIHFYDE